MAPMPALMLAFGGKSGFQALPMQPRRPQIPPPAAPDRAPASDPETSVAELATESSLIDLPAARSESDAAAEQAESDATSDSDLPRSGAGRHSRLLGHADTPPPAGAGQEVVPSPAPDGAESAEYEPAVATDGATEPETAKPSHPHRLEMTIDSLPHHDLTEPIPIYIDPLGDTVFTAAMGNLDISATGNSIGEALVLLKEQIEHIYSDLNRRVKRTPDQTMTLQMLHTYIAPSGAKPAWL